MNFIKNMLKYASEKKGINYNKMVEYCRNNANDKRYKPRFISSTTSWGYNQTGIIEYKKQRYYYKQYKTDVIIKEA